MNKAYLLLGSNLNNRLELLEKARKQIGKHAGKVISCSSVYETEAWGFLTEERFLNQVILLETDLMPGDLLEVILEIERSMGRQRPSNGGYQSRIIDIDIIFYDDSVIEQPDLTIPHPRLQERKFALMPLCELNRELVHPVFKKTVAELAEECNDAGHVELFLKHKVRQD